ncbi:MAG: ABC transporter ATP-binding protein [Spirochaetes bacterium]|nr:ABC transporter ATP-binding protein [Spirochaetota bacterium]
MIKLFKYLRPFGFQVALIVVLIFLQTMADLSLPTLMSDIVDKGIAMGNTAVIWKTGIYMLIVAFIAITFNISAGYLSARTAIGFGMNIRKKIFSKVTAYSLDEIDKFGTASLITRTTNDVTQVQTTVFMITRMMLMAPIMAIGGIIMAVTKEPKLSWILILVLPLMTMFIVFLTVKGFPLFGIVQKKLDRINLVLRENLTGIRVIRAFDKILYEQKRFDNSNMELTDATLKVNRLVALLFPFVMLVMSLTPVLIVWVSGPLLENGSIQFGSLMAFIQYSTQIMFSVIMITMMFIMIPRAQASAVRINEILESDTSIKNSVKTQFPDKPAGFIEFRNVTFSYHGAEQPALNDISFTAGPGKVTAVIGGTGSGKSTLVNLIPRFYDTAEGEILVDGINIKFMEQEKLRSLIGLVPQQSRLFTGSISDNVKFGNDSADDAEIRHAAETAQAYGFIMEKKNKFYDIIEQGGLNISGGQKQRIAIARAVVRKPLIYIFDDSFSALDFKTDAQLRRELRKETENSTVIIVAQRINTVMDADNIIVLDEGRIIGSGTHSQLISACSVYREIVESQMTLEETV